MVSYRGELTFLHPRSAASNLQSPDYVHGGGSRLNATSRHKISHLRSFLWHRDALPQPAFVGRSAATNRRDKLGLRGRFCSDLAVTPSTDQRPLQMQALLIIEGAEE